MRRYRLTLLFLATAVVAIAIAALVVNLVIGKLAEDELTRQAEANSIGKGRHVEGMMWNLYETHRVSPTQPMTLEFLLVEDNPGDVRLTLEALKEAKVLNRVSTVADGMEALAFLHREGKHTGAARPDLILLDLNLPRKDGREVLAELKTDEGLRRIPVVVLTSSSAEQDILKTYDLHANCFITKPVDLDQFLAVGRAIEDFWLTLVKLPPS